MHVCSQSSVMQGAQQEVKASKGQTTFQRLPLKGPCVDRVCACVCVCGGGGACPGGGTAKTHLSSSRACQSHRAGVFVPKPRNDLKISKHTVSPLLTEAGEHGQVGVPDLNVEATLRYGTTNQATITCLSNIGDIARAQMHAAQRCNGSGQKHENEQRPQLHHHTHCSPPPPPRTCTAANRDPTHPCTSHVCRFTAPPPHTHNPSVPFQSCCLWVI